MKKIETKGAGVNDIKQFVKMVESLGGAGKRRGLRDAFCDFVEFAFQSVSSKPDVGRVEKVLERYEQNEVVRFFEMAVLMNDGLTKAPRDFLGEVYMNIQINQKKSLGQVFTPYHISRLMVELTMGDEAEVRKAIEEKGFFAVQDPACGAGSMLIAAYETLKNMGVDTSREVYFEGRDIDALCCKMSIIQLTVLGVPARIVHGDTITGEIYDEWYTAACANFPVFANGKAEKEVAT